MRRTAVLAAMAALAFAGCGGDDEPAANAAARATPRRRPKPPRAPTEAAGGGAKLAIAADPGGANKFTETELTAHAGEVTIEFANESSGAARRRDRGRRRRGDHRDRDRRRRAPLTVDLKPGEYTVLLPGRRSPRRRHGGQAHGPVVEDPLEVARHEQRGARARRAGRTAARSGRCRASACGRRRAGSNSWVWCQRA